MASGADTAQHELKRFDGEEIALLALLSRGRTARTIARTLDCSERTVRRRTHELCERVGVDTPIEVVVLAVRHGVI